MNGAITRLTWLAAALLAASAAASDKPVSAPSTPASIPFVLRDNLVTIDTVIDGHKHTAVLDSGAGAVVVDRAFARRLGLGEEKADGAASGGGEQAQALHPVTLARLDVGPLRFDRLPAYAVDLAHLTSSAGFPVELLIGAPGFTAGKVTVDYRRNLVTFGPSGGAGKCALAIPLTIVHDAPVIEVAVRTTPGAAPVRLKLIIDLGTRHHALMLGGPFVRSAAGQALMQAGVAQQVGHGIGGEVQGSVSRVAALQLGTTSIADVAVALTSAAPVFEAAGVDGVLGVPFWKSGIITFDYPARTLCIER